MKQLARRLVYLATATTLCGLVAGCNLQWSPYAAKVGRTEITPSQLDAALKHASSDKSFSCLLEATSKSGYRLRGAGSDTYDSSFSAFILTDLIDSKVAHAIVVKDKLEEPSSARSLAAAEVSTALQTEASQAGCTGASAKALSQLGRSLTRSFVKLQLDEDVLAARSAHLALTSSAIKAYERANPTTTKESCLTGIFFKTKAEADAVSGDVTKGASFSAEVSKYSSTATSSAGVLGCYTAASLSSISSAIESAVATTKTAAVTSPIPYEDAYLLAEVTSRPFESVVAAINQIFSEHATAFSQAISAGVGAMSIEVNPQYGSWRRVSTKPGSAITTGLGGRVVPPKGPAANLVLNESVLEGPLHKSASSTSSGA